VNFDTIGGDYFIFDFNRQAAVGKRTKKIFRTGDFLSVIITKVDFETLKLHLEIDK